MAVYTEVSAAMLAEIAAAYALSAPLSLTPIAEGVENSNYLLRHGGGKAILTIYEKRVNVADLPFFLGYMEHLAAAGIPCPEPLLTKSGADTLDLAGKKAALISFLEGRSASVIRNTHISELGAWLARMHRAAETFAGERQNDLSLSGWQALRQKIGERGEDVQTGLTAQIDAELAFLQEHWPTTLPRGVIHADLFPDNVFFQNDVLSGIIDFYFACNDFFIYDLAIVLNAWCFERNAEFNTTKAAVLLASYHTVHHFSAEERRALPILCRGAALRFLLTRLHDWVFHPEGALVTPKDPLEYLRKLHFHQRVTSIGEYGL